MANSRANIIANLAVTNLSSAIDNNFTAAQTIPAATTANQAINRAQGDARYAPISVTGGVTSVAGKAGAVTLVVADVSGAQPTLVSGTNIRTVNGNTLLGSTDLVVSGGATSFAGLAGNLALGQIPIGGSSSTYLRGDGTWNSPSGAGTVTSASVVSANGFAGTVATATSTPAITLSTTITGLLKGNGTAISAAANTDLPAMSATVGGAVPTPPNNTTTFLRGDGTFAAAQATLVSGTNIKTINSNSILGSGDLAVGYINIPQNSQSVAYTTVLSDQGKHILHPTADTTARTYTIDSNANVAYPIGTAITFINQNAAGVLTIAITTDTVRLAGAGTTGSRTLAANGVATAIKLTATEWIISGTGLT